MFEDIDSKIKNTLSNMDFDDCYFFLSTVNVDVSKIEYHTLVHLIRYIYNNHYDEFRRYIEE